VSSLAAGAGAVRLDLEGGELEGLAVASPPVPVGWRQVDEPEAVARGLPACLRC
jgi:hypothetical protein